MLWVLVVLFWVAFLSSYVSWLRPRFAGLEARRDEIGDRVIPMGRQLRTVAVCVVGSATAMAVAVMAGFGALGCLLGSVVLAAMLVGVVSLTMRDAEHAQAR